MPLKFSRWIFEENGGFGDLGFGGFLILFYFFDAFYAFGHLIPKYNDGSFVMGRIVFDEMERWFLSGK